MMFQIRNAERKDCAIIGELIRAMAIYEKLADKIIWDQKTLEYELFEEKNAYVLLGEEDGQIIGFALYFFNFSTFVGRKGLYLEDLFIQEAFRKKGYGKQFFRHLAKIALDHHCGRMEWVCLDWNQPSIDFYIKKVHAQPMKDWTVYRLNEDQFENIITMD